MKIWVIEEQDADIVYNSTWICTHEKYEYMADSLESLVHILNTEWEEDQHLVG